MAEQIFKAFICFGEKPTFIPLEKEASFLNGGLLFGESIFIGIFNYVKSLET